MVQYCSLKTTESACTFMPRNNKGEFCIWNGIFFKVLFSSSPVHQWQILKLRFLWISSRNQRLGRRNQPGPGSPKSGNWQRSCWRCRPCRSCWCFPGTRFHLETFCGTPPENSVQISVEVMKSVYECYNCNLKFNFATIFVITASCFLSHVTHFSKSIWACSHDYKSTIYARVFRLLKWCWKQHNVMCSIQFD